MKKIKKDDGVSSFINYIIDHINTGLIILGKNDKIVQINHIAQKLLKTSEISQGSKLPDIHFFETKKNILDFKEYIIQMGSVTYTTAGKFYPINIDNYNKIFIFHKTNHEEEGIYQENITTPKRDINKILGVSPEIISIREQIQTIASSMSNVFITGESGTGKELVAMALHSESKRSAQPFVALNCASIPENLMESELFGYVKGAFTGADPLGRIGLLESANNGTLFLDEIGDMPIYLQVKLLRILEKREFTKLGSNKVTKINIRVVAATNKDMENLIGDGKFREDLYYRLNVIPIKLPPLRERKEDIKVLAKNFIDKYSSLLNKTVSGIDDNFWKKIQEYSWPGNIRELQNTTEYVVNLMKYTEVINYKLLPPKILGEKTSPILEENYNLEYLEKNTIQKLLKIHMDSPNKVDIISNHLGIGRATLYRKLKKYNL